VLSLDLKDAWPRAWHLLPHADLLGCNAALGGCGAWGAWQRAEGLMRQRKAKGKTRVGWEIRDFWRFYPLVNVYTTMERSTIFVWVNQL